MTTRWAPLNVNPDVSWASSFIYDQGKIISKSHVAYPVKCLIPSFLENYLEFEGLMIIFLFVSNSGLH